MARYWLAAVLGLSLTADALTGATWQSRSFAADSVASTSTSPSTSPEPRPKRLPRVVPETTGTDSARSVPLTPYAEDSFAKSLEAALRSLAADGGEQAKMTVPVTPHQRERFDDSISSVLNTAILMPPTHRTQETHRTLESDCGDPSTLLPARSATGNTAAAKTEFDLPAFKHAIDAALASSVSNQAPLDDFASRLDASHSDLADDCGDYASKPYFHNDFSPTPIPNSAMVHDGGREAWVYDSKRAVPVQHPWVEWGRIWYGDGITPRGKNWFGDKNMVRPQFYVYGDYRTGIASGRNAAGRTDNWAQRLNLDLDLRMTDTERFHMFVGPLDQDGRFTRWELVDGDLNYENEFDINPLTGFFEGDLGVLMGTLQNSTSPMEIPFTVGLVPLLFQNGIWMEDAVTGAAFSIPARHSRLLNWSNYDATFFAAVDQINSPAFGTDEHRAQMLGTAWFIEAYGGYIETGYAFLHDRNDDDRSYHNITASFTRRYFDRISNSVRVIVNAGQDLPDASRTADGALLLFENSWITDTPLTFVPYLNMFVGWDRPQSVARAGGSGGILRNTGINFDTDGLNGFATLDTSASDTAGGSIGVDLIGDDLDRQLLLEAAYLTPHGSKNPNVPDDQFAVGSRYQFPISHCTLMRFDVMYGWRRGLQDVYGTRMEYRWKF